MATSVSASIPPYPSILMVNSQDSKPSKLLPPKKYAALPIDFLIIGGGIAGLSSAIALTRVGHRVTLIERDATVDHVSTLFASRSTPKVDNHLRKLEDAV